MSSKFFNNNTGNTLFDKLKGIASGMANFDRFLAVVGFFRSSGYFKLRKELKDVKEIKILVGINIDDIFRRHNYTQQPRRLGDLSKPYKGDKVQIKQNEEKLKREIAALAEEYQTISKEKQEEAAHKVSDPQIIISETFI